MLTMPDFREKTVVFFQASNDLEHKLKFLNQNVVFSKDDKTETKVSCHRLLALFIVGDFSLTTQLIQKCGRYGISLVLLKRNFSTYASFFANAEGNVLLRMKQYSCSPDFALEISKKLIENKVRNQLNLLRYIGVDAIRDEERKVYRKRKVEEIKEAVGNKVLLGIEGSVSRDFFGLYFKELGWKKRAPRTKLDEINFLLDLGYSMLFNYIESLCRIFGFDVFKGVYHQEFYQRKSLVCDLIEPFRCIIDKTILKSFNLGQFNKSEFKSTKYRCSLTYEISSKYSHIFFKEILANKEDVYNFIKTYYYYILNETGDFPVFEIR